MIAASAVGLFVIPMLYVTFQSIRERSSARFRRLTRRPDPLPTRAPPAKG